MPGLVTSGNGRRIAVPDGSWRLSGVLGWLRSWSPMRQRTDAALAAMDRLGKLSCAGMDRGRLRFHVELLAIKAGIPVAEAGSWGRAAGLHLVGCVGVAGADVAAAALGRRLLGGHREPVLRLAHGMAAAMAERWDGSGQPDGLAGTAIPLAGRVAAVARQYELAMAELSGRPFAAELALGRLRGLAGRTLDPELTREFGRLAGDGWARAQARARPDPAIPVECHAAVNGDPPNRSDWWFDGAAPAAGR
ncbi:MAG: hypothetical protein INR65_04600 [Gluconacetobacter diazotrophicus]|nr:hypothetical protein [Gluconacetobacter diazotrophicus]